MTYEQTVWIIVGILMVIILGFFIFMSVLDFKKNKEKYIITRESEEARFNEEIKTVTIRAEVIDMNCGVHTVGYQAYKQPKAIRYFVIRFKSEDGEIFDVNVSEEMYQGFDIGLVGMLSLVDGQLNSFELVES